LIAPQPQPKPGTVLILNGTSSSGKTSILKELQNILSEPFIDAGIDKFIWMLPQRYLDRPLWDDVLGLATSAGETGHRLFSGMHHTIAALSAAGNHVIADHVLVEPSWVTECARLFHNLPAYLIGIKCPLEVLEQRERDRKDRTLGQACAQFGVIHRDVTYDLEIDTSTQTVTESALTIKTWLETQPQPAAFKRILQHSEEDHEC
jgi:chloramphenicol 3-O phosphotransferase